jgi:hypothetical protein
MPLCECGCCQPIGPLPKWPDPLHEGELEKLKKAAEEWYASLSEEEKAKLHESLSELSQRQKPSSGS